MKRVTVCRFFLRLRQAESYPTPHGGRVWNGLGTLSERSRNGLGPGSIGTDARTFRDIIFAWQAQHFAGLRFRLRGRRSTFASADLVAHAALRKEVQTLWQAQHFPKIDR